MKNKIRLDTFNDVKRFCEAVSQLNVDVFLVDPKNKYQVNAKSILGCLLS